MPIAQLPKLSLMSTDLLSPAVGIGGVVQEYLWNWENQQLRVVYETLGTGSPILLLPAFSTVSMRSEMGELAKLLSPHFQVVAVDWLGFGESWRASLDYRPELYQQFLQDFVKSIFIRNCSNGAGHAAGYVLQLAVNQPDVVFADCVVAPTWRCPLPDNGASQQMAVCERISCIYRLFSVSLSNSSTLTPSFLIVDVSRHSLR
jgi:pimeloyl-ACP methyl ester carboxylesterase